MDPKDLQPGGGGSPNAPANGGNPQGDGAEPSGDSIDLASLPEPVRKRIENAEGIISDLKTAAGVKSAKELREKLTGPKPAAAPAAPATDDSRNVTHEELHVMNQGYSPEEISVARSLKPGVKLGEALNDSTVKAAIAGIRAERKTQQHIPEPTGRTPVLNGKPFAELPAQDQKANYAGIVAKALERGKRGSGRNVGS